MVSLASTNNLSSGRLALGFFFAVFLFFTLLLHVFCFSPFYCMFFIFCKFLIFSPFCCMCFFIFHPFIACFSLELCSRFLFLFMCQPWALFNKFLWLRDKVSLALLNKFLWLQNCDQIIRHFFPKKEKLYGLGLPKGVFRMLPSVT